MKVKIYVSDVFNPYSYKIEDVGYIEMEEFDEQKAWEICNWSCYQDEKPKELFSDIKTAASNVAFYNEETGKYYISLSAGFAEVDNYRDMIKEFFKIRSRFGLNVNDMVIPKENYKVLFYQSGIEFLIIVHAYNEIDAVELLKKYYKPEKISTVEIINNDIVIDISI